MRIKRSNTCLAASLFLSIILATTSFNAYAIEQRCLKTSYCEIFYPDDKVLSDFFWRISGRRFDFVDDISLARSRVDRLVDRVKSILGMYPAKFRIRVYLYPQYEKGDIAIYYSATNSVTVYVDKVTDGVFAHELAHGIICNYFAAPPSDKVQEILAQHVDRYLWEGYAE